MTSHLKQAAQIWANASVYRDRVRDTWQYCLRLPWGERRLVYLDGGVVKSEETLRSLVDQLAAELVLHDNLGLVVGVYGKERSRLGRAA